MASKIFILSVNSIASRADSLLRFGTDNVIVIPMVNIDELSKLAHQYNEKGRNAQKVLEYLDEFNFDELSSEEGVKQNNGSILRIENNYRDVDIVADNLSHSDLRRLQIALGLQNKHKGKEVILISKNPAFRLKAKSLGIKSQNYKDEVFPSLKEQFRGRIEATTTANSLKKLIKTMQEYKDSEGEAKSDEVSNENYLKVEEIHNFSQIELVPNLFFELSALDQPSLNVIARYDGEKIVRLNYGDSYSPYGITPKNAGQKMLIEALMMDCAVAPIVIVKGGAGTGKTYQTLACALEQVSEQKIYSQIMISTSTATVGNEEIGFLPGEIENKFAPHIGGLRDNLRILLNARKREKEDPKGKVETGQYFFENGTIQMEPIGFFRGRTIVDTFCIIDETQNISPDDIKSIVSRAGEGSKFIFLGDPTQIDNPKLNENYNGLVFLSEKMKGYKGAWQITLNEEESVRSELAKLAAKIL